MTINVHEAKTHFSKLLQRVAAGQEVTIAKAGVPVARLVPLTTAIKPRELGKGRGTMQMAANFDAPLPRKLLDAFQGGKQERRRR